MTILFSVFGAFVGVIIAGFYNVYIEWTTTPDNYQDMINTPAVDTGTTVWLIVIVCTILSAIIGYYITHIGVL